MNVELIGAIGGHITDATDGIRSKPPNRGPIFGSVEIFMPGAQPAPLGGIVNGGIVDMHSAPERLPGRFKEGFSITANGVTLKTPEFTLKTAPDGDGLVISCAEGSLHSKTFTLKPDEEALRKVHPGLVAASSAAIHHFGVDPGYETWRRRLKTRLRSAHSDGAMGLEICGGRVYISERNTPPLFGLGLIDALPDEILVATAEREPPQVRGRVSRMTSGRIGRFGWKAQTSDLREFILGACAGELGLEVPGHPQPASPLAPEARAKAPDLTAEECDAMVAYVRALPAPIQLAGPAPREIEAGREAFQAIGCADCHRPRLGEIEGIYSDLLMHDMGPDLVSVALSAYYPMDKVDAPTTASLAEGSEWRTPPLWGYRDSGPYLHDGRARDLREIVKFHGGQAAASAGWFVRLSTLEQAQVERFLESLAAPVADATAVISGGPAAPAGRRSMLGSPSNPAPPRSTLTRIDGTTHARRERLSASRLKMARALEEMGKPRGALVFYREIVRDEPGTDAARTAAERIKALGGQERIREEP